MQNSLAYMKALGLHMSRLCRLPRCSLPITPARTATPHHPAPTTAYREMATKGKTSGIPHKLRTAAEPRQNRLYAVRLSHIEQVNPSVRLFQLTIPPHVQSVETTTPNEAQEDEDQTPQPLSFLPGQWLDVHIPSISNAGGFSITSTPADATVLPQLEQPAPTADGFGSYNEIGVPAVDDAQGGAGRPPFVELAVQYAPANPASAWFWKPREEILGAELGIRVGGSFVWPPEGINLDGVRNIVFIAGGVGINPIISMLSHLNNNDSDHPLPHSTNIQILYSTKLRESEHDDGNRSLDQILFLSRLRHIAQSQCQSHRLRIGLDLFLTDLPAGSSLTSAPPVDLAVHARRINRSDLEVAVRGADGSVKADETVCYLCGPPWMTDELGGVVRTLLGNGQKRVFFEKWW